MLVRCHKQGLLPPFQRHSVGGGQFEVLRRGCGSTAKEGYRKEDEIDYGFDGFATDEYHATTLRTCAADVGRREPI